MNITHDLTRNKKCFQFFGISQKYEIDYIDNFICEESIVELTGKSLNRNSLKMHIKDKNPKKKGWHKVRIYGVVFIHVSKYGFESLVYHTKNGKRVSMVGRSCIFNPMRVMIQKYMNDNKMKDFSVYVKFE